MTGLNYRTYLELVRFKRDESGVATIFACFMIMMMVVVGGIGVDLMHNEMERTRLQNTLDRAVLAAADLDQTLDPDAVVRDYFDKAGMGAYLSSVDVDPGLNYRTVTATASTVSQTQFMHLMGVNELKVPAIGTAEERISNVEVSLVLDISASMSENDRIGNMRDAADVFVRKLIRPETQNLISINIVPYAEHVSVGEPFFNAMPNTNSRHGYSWCLEIPNDNFDEADIFPTVTYEQMQHFQWYDDELMVVDNPSCPSRDYEGMTAHSQNLTALTTQISQLQPRNQTSIFLGVKWGAALLDPSTRPAIANLHTAGVVDAAFKARPSEYTDPETLKTIVVMTDGVNTESYRISDWAYSTESHYEHWRYHNFARFLEEKVSVWNHWKFVEQKYDGAMGDMLTDQICTAAKAEGIVIWSVGFEVDDHGANVLKKCASSPSHFFRVEGVEISEAFSAIASQINQLRLTQ